MTALVGFLRIRERRWRECPARKAFDAFEGVKGKPEDFLD